MKRSHLALMVLSLLLSSSLLLGLHSHVSAQLFGGHRGGGPGKGFLSSLTDEQRGVVQELISEMREQGASREEIHEAVGELLAQWGIELPERPGGKGKLGGFRHDRRDFMEDLTDGQRAAIRGQTLELWQDGATGREIHDAVREMLQEFGVELPEHPAGPRDAGGFGHRHTGLMAPLSQEQREEIHQMIREMRNRDATGEQTRAAVQEKMQQWGIELPEPPAELTAEQRKTLRAVVYELWQDGATGEEIRAAAAEQFEEYGLQMPEHGWDHFDKGPLGHFHRCLKPELNQEQREAVHETTRELQRQGASPEEVHEAVRALLEDLGVDLPDLSILSNEQRATTRTTALDLWLSGVPQSEMCDAIKEMLADFGIEGPEDAGRIGPTEKGDEAPIQAQNYPNPANPETMIQYSISVPGKVQIQIFNISGQLVRAFDMGYLQPGSYSVTWDGRRHDGLPVASGVYFYKIQAGLHSVTHRMVLLK
ncbi:MAG: hypothetical protein AMJ92_05470 [candidate division Zixibacteria bacterium SM23_81]|nr:MAG: hypothetical protein AMJ92_05470 [candidate division Zixibacteria bacterium SM23_81]